MARTISSSFAAKRRMISSDGRVGASGLAAGGGVGNLVDSGGCMGPAACANNGLGAAMNIKVSAPHEARICDFESMGSRSTCWMQIVAILQHGYERNSVEWGSALRD